VNIYQITQPPVITASLSTSGSIVCSGTSNAILVVSASGGIPPFQYSIDGFNFQVSDTFMNAGSGTYTGFVRDAIGCTVATNSVTISEANSIGIDYIDQEITLGESIQMEATLLPPGLNVASISWTPADGLSCTDCLAPVASPRQTTTYTVTITDSAGCTATTDVTITVNENFRVLTPNIFTPNGDGNNDFFSFHSFGAEIVEVRIFNRWGAQVYYNANQPEGDGNGWDGTFNGKESPEGTYVFTLNITFANSEIRQQTGTITLVR
jgi:gliding motility-associated-like protein